jgi:ADP-heptose:LPS heptosyltransferase
MVGILALRALGLGDFLTAVPALRGLRRAASGRELALATHPGVATLVAWTELVDDQIFVTDLRQTAAFRPQVAVNLHGSGPESHRWLLATQPRALLAYAHPAIDVRGPAWRAEEHEVHRWCRLLGWAGVLADPDDLSIPAPPDPLDADPDRVVVHVGAAAPARRWPVERWAAVASELAGDGLHVVLTGTRSERPLAEAVAARAGLDRGAVIAGDTDLVRLAGIVASARLVLAGDTGVGHLATALGRPSVLLFGPTSPARWGPPPDRPIHAVLWAGVPGDPHGDEPSDGLLAIAVDDVIDAARERLGADVSLSMRAG